MSRIVVIDMAKPTIATPCTIRSRMNPARFDENAHPKEAPVFKSKAARMTGLRPTRSESGPLINCAIAETTRYPANVELTEEFVALKSREILSSDGNIILSDSVEEAARIRRIENGIEPVS